MIINSFVVNIVLITAVKMFTITPVLIRCNGS
jgi:hypothetical protein